MGAALSVIDGSRVLGVPRTRFAPVKTTDDLLVLRSDAYVLSEDGSVLPAPGTHDAAGRHAGTLSTSSSSATSSRVWQVASRRCASATASSCAATCGSGRGSSAAATWS